MKMTRITNTMLAIGLTVGSFAQKAKPGKVAADVLAPIKTEKYFDHIVSADTVKVACPCGDSIKTVLAVANFNNKKGAQINKAYLYYPGCDLFQVSGSNSSKILLKDSKYYLPSSLKMHKRLTQENKAFLPDNEYEEYKTQIGKIKNEAQKTIDSLENEQNKIVERYDSTIIKLKSDKKLKKITNNKFKKTKTNIDTQTINALNDTQCKISYTRWDAEDSVSAKRNLFKNKYNSLEYDEMKPYIKQELAKY